MAFKTILVATDFCPEAEVAVERAASIARSELGVLHLLYVEHELEQRPKYGGVSSETLSEVQQMVNDHRSAMRAKLQALCDELAGQGVNAISAVRTGHPEEVIVEYAEEISADLIVCGTHGRKGLKRFLLGSVAEKVARTAATNVLVARKPRSESGNFDRVLVPTDFSPASARALDLALRMAGDNAHVDLYHAWQYPPGTHASGLPDVDGSPIAAMREEITQTNEAEAGGWVRRHKDSELTLHFVQDFGPPAVLVQERLESESYDLVAMGTHGYRGFRRFILGSVAEATVRHAPCSVFIAHAGNLES